VHSCIFRKITFGLLNNFILIGLCILAGWLLRRLRILPDDAHRGINVWVIYIAVPAVSLKYIPYIHWSSALLLPAVMPIIVWVGSWLIFKLYSLRWPMDDASRTALTLTAGLGNTSFIGFPLIMGYYGQAAMPTAVISDQVSFIVMSTIGATMAMSQASTDRITLADIVKKLIQFPPFVAFFIAISIPVFMLAPVVPLIDRLADTLAPLALFSVGMQLSFSGWRADLRYLAVGLGYKLLIAPTLILLIIVVAHLHGIIPQISLFEAAMAPMITAGVIATQYNLNPKLANLMVGIGILLSFITTGIWYYVLKAFS